MVSESHKDQSKVEIVSDFARFTALRQKWEALHRAAGGGPFSSFDWVSSWLEVYLTDAIKMRIILVWDGDDLAVAVPLACENLRISERLPFKAKTRSYMDLTPVKQSEALAALVSAAQQKGLWVNTRDEIETAIADVSGGLEAYMTRLSSSTRKKMRSLDRKLRKEGAEVQIAGQAGAGEDAVLAAALDVSSRSWKAQGGTDIGSQSSDRAFFEALYRRLSPKGKIRVMTTELDGRLMKAVIAMTCCARRISRGPIAKALSNIKGCALPFVQASRVGSSQPKLCCAKGFRLCAVIRPS